MFGWLLPVGPGPRMAVIGRTWEARSPVLSLALAAWAAIGRGPAPARVGGMHMRGARWALALAAVWGGACDCDGAGLSAVKGDLVVTPAALDFGEVVVGELGSAQVSLRAIGVPEVPLERVALEGDAQAFLLPDGAPTSVGAAAVGVTVVFAPAGEGDFTATLAVDAPETEAGRATVALRGRGVRRGLGYTFEGPPCGASGASFGLVPRGREARLTVTVEATGSAPLTLSGLAVDQTASQEISILEGPEVGEVLAPGGEVQVTLRYFPQDNGEDRATLRVETEEGVRLRVPVCGTGVAVAICAAPDPLDFGAVAQGSPAGGIVRLTSCGDEPLRIESVAVADDPGHPTPVDFAVGSPPGLGVDLAPGEGLDAAVTFTPGVQGPRQGWLRVRSNAPETPELFVALVGTGAPPCQLTVVPSRLTFFGVPVGGSDVRQVLVVNDEATRCVVSRLESAGPEGALFSVLPPASAGITVEPGGSAVVGVQYAPTVPGSGHLGRLELETDSRQVRTVDLVGNAALGPGCQLDVRPGFLRFGASVLGSTQRRGVTLVNLSGGTPCTVSQAAWLSGGSAAFRILTAFPQLIAPGASLSLEVEYAPTQEAADRAVLRLSSDDPDDPQLDVPAFGVGRSPRICVTPSGIDFGATSVAQTRSITVSACGGEAVTVSAVELSPADVELALVLPVAPPWSIPAGQTVSFEVRYTPGDDTADWSDVVIRSDDLLQPQVRVPVRGGPDEFPPEVGQNLYVWQLGDVLRFPLQGGLPGAPFWGNSTGRGCSGCHAVSPDGRYLALVEYPSFTVVDTQTGLEVPTGLTAEVHAISWNPDPNTTPPYQFVYADGLGVIQKAALSGPLGSLAGADDPAFAQRMPSWGPTGAIAFARAPLASSQGPAFGFMGPVDLMVVPEAGGVAVPVVGASGTPNAHYYPAWSPTGDWIAFTYSASAVTTYAAADAQVRLVRADQSGQVDLLPFVNGAGAASYPTWSLDGRALSFSSNRAGGLGDWDVYLSFIDNLSGQGSPAQAISAINTASFDHLAVWAR